MITVGYSTFRARSSTFKLLQNTLHGVIFSWTLAEWNSTRIWYKLRTVHLLLFVEFILRRGKKVLFRTNVLRLVVVPKLAIQRHASA